MLAVAAAGLSLLIQTAPATGAGPAATGTPPSTTAAPLTFEQQQKSRMKCEKIVLLGSRMPVRVCRTPEQLKQSQADARDTTIDFQKINPEQLSK